MIESFGSAPKGIVKQKIVIADCGSAGEGMPVGPPPPPPCPKVFFDMTAGKTLEERLAEREAKALERPRVGVGENYPLTIDENTTNVDGNGDSEPPECKSQ